MKLAQLETFVVVAEELHFRRAAERLFTQPSTVSTQISQLEAEYGTQLFIRNSRNVELSPAGHILLQKAREALAGIAELETTARRLAAADDVTLNVGVMDEGLAELTPIVQRNYLARYPNSRLTITSLDYHVINTALTDGAMDVIVCVSPESWFEPDRVTNHALFAEEVAAVLWRDHPLASHNTISKADLFDEPFLRINGLHDAIHRIYMLTDERIADRSPDVEVDAEHMVNILNHVALGRGTMTVTRGTERFYRRPDVAFVPVDDLPPGVSTLTLRRDDRRPHVLAFAEECVNAVRTSLDLIPTAVDVTGTAA